MKNYTIKLSVAVLAAFVLLGMADSASAQRRRESRNRMWSKSQVKKVVDRLETRVDYFVKQYDRALDHSRLNGSRREDVLNGKARELESATDSLRSNFDRHDAWADSRDDVRRCLELAADINRNMRRMRAGGGTEGNWANVRRELNTLADIYNMPPVGAR